MTAKGVVSLLVGRHKGSHAVFKHGAKEVMEFPIVLEQEEDGRYSVYAPDLPGCTSWGNTREEAVEHIREAIELWIESAEAEGAEIPVAGSSLEFVRIAS